MLIGGVAFGVAMAAQPDEGLPPIHQAYGFADGAYEFCGGGPLNVGYATFPASIDLPNRSASEPSEAVNTPEVAVAAFLEQLRAAANGAFAPPESPIKERMSDAMRRTNSFDAPERSDVSETLVYFDRSPTGRTAESAGDLDARLVVEFAAGEYRVTQYYICDHLLVEDPRVVEELWAEVVAP